METAIWPSELIVRIGEAVQKERYRQGLTGQRLADACTALGVKMDRAAISKIENGRRATLELAEVLVLARALNTAPVDLVFPLNGGATTAISAGERVPMWEAAQWFGAEDPGPEPAEGSPRALHELFRFHRRAQMSAERSWAEASARRRTAAEAIDPVEREDSAQAADYMERMANLDYRNLLKIRERLRDQGITPPPLPPALAFIEAKGAKD